MKYPYTKPQQRPLNRVPWRGTYVVLLFTLFQWKLALAVFNFNLKLRLVLACLTYSNCSAAHRVEATPVFLSRAIWTPWGEHGGVPIWRLKKKKHGKRKAYFLNSGFAVLRNPDPGLGTLLLLSWVKSRPGTHCLLTETNTLRLSSFRATREFPVWTRENFYTVPKHSFLFLSQN